MLTREHASRVAVDRAVGLIGHAPSLDRTYKSDRDFATATDFAVEDELRDLLHELTPDVGFLGEERGHSGPRDPYWCLDPIDGTTNFSRGIPNFGVALALVDNGVPTHGEIALPAHSERYVTRDGLAYCNDGQVQASQTTTLGEALVAVGDFATGPGSRDKNHNRLATLSRLANEVARVRMLGSAATDLAWLAAGHLDAVIMHANKSWDVAAGVALARAAGATITHHDGSPHTLTGPDIVAAAPGVHTAILGLLDSAH